MRKEILREQVGMRGTDFKEVKDTNLGTEGTDAKILKVFSTTRQTIPSYTGFLMIIQGSTAPWRPLLDMHYTTQDELPISKITTYKG